MDDADILKRLDKLEKSNGEMAETVKALRDSLTVMVYIQNKQAAVQKTQAEDIAASEARFQRIETNLAEITDKLNGLIRYMDNQTRTSPPPE